MNLRAPLSVIDDTRSTKLPNLLSKHMAYACIIIGTSLFSIKAIFIKFAYQYDVSVSTLLCLRMLLALPFYFSVLIYMQRKYPQILRWRDIAQIAGVGALGYYLASLFDLHALQYISVGLERMILYSYPGIVMLLSIVLFGLKPKAREWTALIISFIGVTIVFYQDIQLHSKNIMLLGVELPEVLLGVILCFFAACSFAFYLVNSEALIKRFSSQRFTALAMIGASSAVLCHFLLSEPWSNLLSQAKPVYFYAFAIAFFSTVLPSFLISAGIQLVGANKASLLGFLGPIAAILAAWFFLGEAITAFHIIGFSIVFMGMAILGNIRALLANKNTAHKSVTGTKA